MKIKKCQEQTKRVLYKGVFVDDFVYRDGEVDGVYFLFKRVDVEKDQCGTMLSNTILYVC